MKAALYLIPVAISDAPPTDVIPQGTIDIMAQISHFIVENTRTARRWLRRCLPHCDIDAMTFHELNRHTDLSQVSTWLNPLRQGTPIGIMSEAGCPGIADPGAIAVAIAQREHLPVIPLTGPSSILLALMASGCNGQGFSFHGYLPIPDDQRTAAIRRLEKIALQTSMTQIFIETPYRNRRLLDTLIKTLHPDTTLCVAADITSPTHEQIISLPAAKWKNITIDLDKTPAVFIIGNHN